ncbi:YdcF family protein [Novosphingobium clariflavum]|uniref:YdcF family protein n=1 Tax=Novosphingobium clariflavum TaxID=2029884 RepID=A0ABV6SFB5_9SPHN|nr:YdcF family protein [Novosphingobium clariflavum]
MRNGPARRAALAAAAALSLLTVCAQAQAVRDTVAESLSQRLFPALDALGHDPAALRALRDRPEVAAMLRARSDRRAACAADLGCLAQAMIWSDGEAGILAAAVPGKGMDDGPAAQAGREIAGINTIVRTYGVGQVPAYPGIDGAGTIDPQEARARLQAAAWLAQTPRANSVQALDPSLDFALALLDAADRRDAIGDVPLSGGLNAPAFRRARGMDWSRYRYSALVVTGVGPEVEGMPLSPYSKYHLRLAAQRYAAGDAPFLILTGGHAHPRATPFAEAEEMRRALIERYGVPAETLVIEPHARHTTTNLRNAARLLVALGAPLDKATLILCNPDQSAMIESPDFVKRNNRELGYQPGAIGPRVSPTELEFRPSALSLRVDPRDPLDP